eukprot:9991347-Lingulodinium_polyedra.AAC.1
MISDFLRSNGVPAKRFATWPNYVSRPRMGGLIGNSEALCVLVPILFEVLRSLGILWTQRLVGQ